MSHLWIHPLRDNVTLVTTLFEFMISGFEPRTGTYRSSPEHSSEVSREPVRIMLIGSAAGIDLIIKVLHRLGFAEVGDWSEPQTYPSSDRLMSILTKWIRH